MHQRTETRVSKFSGPDYLGHISDLLIISKFHNETHDPKGQENKIYTIVKGMETFYHRPQSPAVVKSNLFLKSYLSEAKNALKN